MELNLYHLNAAAPAPLQPGVVELSNDADPLEVALEGVNSVRLDFPKFTDGRAFSQAVMLRKRRGFKGDICATVEVLIDQLIQMIQMF